MTGMTIYGIGIGVIIVMWIWGYFIGRMEERKINKDKNTFSRGK